MIDIRKGLRSDIPSVFKLVEELAVYEKALSEVSNTEERMEQELFDQPNNFDFLVAVDEKKLVIGTSIYYFRYSTWKGKRIYLEDLIVTESKRGIGAGKMLFDATIEQGKLAGCSGMMWQVLDWNKPAINFYKKYGTKLDEQWINCHLDF